MNDPFEAVKSFFRNTFLPKKRTNWGYPLFIMAVALAALYIAKELLASFLPFTSTSIVFNSLVMPLLTLLALIAPAISLSSGDTDLSINGITGKFTGIGPLLIAFFSGVPLGLVNSAFHNLMAYLWLRLGRSMVFPAFMCYNADDSIASQALQIVTVDAIPALGVSIFFTGLLYSLFREENKLAGTIIIILFYSLYSLNMIDIAGIAITGLWIVILRRKTGNIMAPFLSMIAMKLTPYFFSFIISEVDITTLQTYSDIPVSFFYTSIPALFVSAILFGFFKASLDDFERTYYSDMLGREVDAELEEQPLKILPFVKGLNVSLLIAVIILVGLWIRMLTV